MANYSELLNDINAAIYENNDQEIDALEVRAILREMVTSLGSGYLFKGIATPSSPGTSQAPDQNVFYLATTAGTYTYLDGLVVAAGEVAFLCFDGTWTKKSSALLSTGSIVDNLTTEDATKPLSAKQGKVLADAGAATAAEVTALGQEVRNIFPQTNEDGMYLVDDNLNVAAKYDEDGFDVAKVSNHFIELLKAAGIAGDSPALSYLAFTNEAGFAIVDPVLNIGVKVTDDGIHAQNIVKYVIV